MNIAAINEQLLRAIGVGIAILGEEDLRFRFSNEKFSSWFGVPAPDSTLATVFPGVDLEAMRADLAAGRSHSVELSIKPKRRTLVIALALSRATSNDEALLVAECQNITRMRELESMIESYSAMVERNTREIEREKDRAERLLLIEVITRAANEATSAEEAMRIALDRVCAHTRWPAGHVYQLNETARQLVPSGIWHLDDSQGFEALREAIEGAPSAAESGLLGRVLASGRAAWIDDVSQDPGFPKGALAAGAGVRGAYAFPVQAGDRVVAVLEFFSGEPGQLTDPLLQAMTQICRQLGRVFERVQAQERLVEAREEALGATEAKSHFLANMSHELRTPMNAIVGFTRLVMRQTKPAISDKQYENLEKILISSEHLLELINQLLDLSKIEAGKYDLFLESYDTAALLEETAAAVQPLAKRNGNRLEIRCAEDLGLMYADKTRVRQVVLNLLSNACKFTEGGEVTLEAGRSRIGGADWLHLMVSDTGIGMTPEQCEKVFEAFTQAEGTQVRQYGGTGLGLTISRRLCQMMGGEIDLTSEPGVGSTFTVRLPLVVEAPAQNAEEPT
ncbi:MAG: GAF domain-containing sensor histidine kinase [Pseudomonadota bacterium]